MSRTFASWADPTKGGKTPREPLLHNPLRGFGTDLRLLGRYWRWGRGSRRPTTVLRLPAAQQGPKPAEIRQSSRERFRVLRRANIEVTGQNRPDGPRVLIAHVESPLDMTQFMRSLPSRWHVATRGRRRALARGRSVLWVTDVAASNAADDIAAAARLAAVNSAPLQPVVVRRLVTGTVANSESGRLPRPKREDEVLIRYAPELTDASPVALANEARSAIGDLLAEDDATWWEVLTGQVTSPLVEPMPLWRRLWARTDPHRDQGRTRRQIWS